MSGYCTSDDHDGAKVPAVARVEVGTSQITYDDRELCLWHAEAALTGAIRSRLHATVSPVESHDSESRPVLCTPDATSPRQPHDRGSER